MIRIRESDFPMYLSAIYILGELVKVARLEGRDYVLRNAEELFIFKLMEQSDPLRKKRISHDALDTLDNILDSHHFFRFCVSVLIRPWKISPRIKTISVTYSSSTVKSKITRIERISGNFYKN
ncbi:MAG: hypothetical protein ACRD5B_14380 [Nitrososphaeraceae archaeon]